MLRVNLTLPRTVVSLLWACLMSLAEVYIKMGLYPVAEFALKKALAISEDLHGKNHMLVTRCLQVSVSRLQFTRYSGLP